MNYRFERLSDSNLHHLPLLYYSLYKKHLPVSYFASKYNTAHLTPSKYGYFAFDNQTAAGFTGMIPYALEYQGKKELAVQSVDSMTHPLYMKQGIFKMLMDYVYEDLQKENVSFIWGFPNDASVKSATKKLNWLPTPNINGYYIPIANRYTSYLIRKTNQFLYQQKPLEKNFASEITNEFPLHSLRECDYVTTVRNRAFFDYKKFGGSILVTIQGKKLWLKLNGSLFIGDMDIVSPSELKQIMTELIARAKCLGATNIYFQTHGGSQLDKSFSALYPNVGSWKILYHQLNSTFPLSKIGVTLGDLDSF